MKQFLITLALGHCITEIAADNADATDRLTISKGARDALASWDNLPHMQFASKWRTNITSWPRQLREYVEQQRLTQGGVFLEEARQVQSTGSQHKAAHDGALARASSRRSHRIDFASRWRTNISGWPRQLRQYMEKRQRLGRSSFLEEDDYVILGEQPDSEKREHRLAAERVGRDRIISEVRSPEGWGEMPRIGAPPNQQRLRNAGHGDRIISGARSFDAWGEELQVTMSHASQQISSGLNDRIISEARPFGGWGARLQVNSVQSPQQFQSTGLHDRIVSELTSFEGWGERLLAASFRSQQQLRRNGSEGFRNNSLARSLRNKIVSTSNWIHRCFSTNHTLPSWMQWHPLSIHLPQMHWHFPSMHLPNRMHWQLPPMHLPSVHAWNYTAVILHMHGSSVLTSIPGHGWAALVLPCLVLAAFCLGLGALVSAVGRRRPLRRGPVGQWCETLPRCSSALLQSLGRNSASSIGNDRVALSPQAPLFYRPILRLEGTVEGTSMAGASLMTPLTQKSCVMYSAGVSRHMHGGVPELPLAFCAEAADFRVVVHGDPQVRISVQGQDVSLFDMYGGRCVARQAFSNAPAHWQNFVLVHRTVPVGSEWKTGVAMRQDPRFLEFQECSLLVGARCTLVGELHVRSDGSLALRPPRSQNIACRTTAPVSLGDERAGDPVSRCSRVFLSDDPTLLQSSKPTGYSRNTGKARRGQPLSSFNSLWRRSPPRSRLQSG